MANHTLSETGGELIVACDCGNRDTITLPITAMPPCSAGCGRRMRVVGVYASFDLVVHLTRQRAFSERTFGPGRRTAGVLAHIRKELLEIEEDPTNLVEWIDVILLAFDGAWRAGHSPAAIAEVLDAKQTKNEARDWPDWRTMPTDVPIEHKRDDERTEVS